MIRDKLRKQMIAFSATLIAIFSCAIGTVLYVEVNLGSDAADVFIYGVHHSLNVTLGLANTMFALFFLFAAWKWNRSCIGWPSILFTFFTSYAIDIVNQYIIPINLSDEAFVVRIFILIFAQLCISMTYVIFQNLEKGMSTIDAIIFYIIRRYSFSYVTIRTTLDFIFLVLGTALGGVIGIGTILSVFLTGITTRILFLMIGRICKHRGVKIHHPPSSCFK